MTSGAMERKKGFALVWGWGQRVPAQELWADVPVLRREQEDKNTDMNMEVEVKKADPEFGFAAALEPELELEPEPGLGPGLVAAAE